MKQIKLDSNENPFQFNNEIINDIKEIASKQNYNIYPDSSAYLLRKEIANYINKDVANIMIGNGSDELLLMLILAFAGSGKEVIFSVPTFSMYSIYARISGSRTIQVPLRPDFSLDRAVLDEYLSDGNEGVFIICSPNNPTGNLFTLAEIEDIVVNTNKIVVIDEAYFEFAEQTAIDLTDKYSNLIILRTLSKAFSLAALRIGYLIADLSLIDCLQEVKSPYNCNSFSQRVARLVLQKCKLINETWKVIKNNRKTLYSELETCSGVTPYPSRANFILFNTTVSEKRIYEVLLDKGIKIRYLPGLPVVGNSLRVTVGRKEENSVFLAKLKEVMRWLQ